MRVTHNGMERRREGDDDDEYDECCSINKNNHLHVGVVFSVAVAFVFLSFFVKV